MLRRIIRIFALVSILLWVATVVFFIRSFEMSDFFNFGLTPSKIGGINSSAGTIEMTITTIGQAESNELKLGEWQSIPTSFLTPAVTRSSILGVGIGDLKTRTGQTWYLHVSHLWIAFLFAIGPMLFCVSVYRRRRVKRRFENNQCVACGYDLQGGGSKCPECGVVREKENLQDTTPPVGSR